MSESPDRRRPFTVEQEQKINDAIRGYGSGGAEAAVKYMLNFVRNTGRVPVAQNLANAWQVGTDTIEDTYVGARAKALRILDEIGFAESGTTTTQTGFFPYQPNATHQTSLIVPKPEVWDKKPAGDGDAAKNDRSSK